MGNQVPVHSTVRPLVAPESRPVLAVMIGPSESRRGAVPRVVDGLGHGVILLSLRRNMSRQRVRLVHKDLSDCLASGKSVLLNAANDVKPDRRALLDIAARHLASTLAVVCSPIPVDDVLLASLPGEGWHAVVVVAR